MTPDTPSRSTEHGSCNVIVPTFLHAEYIAQTLSSLLNQTRRPSKIIVVNDGSPDDTDNAVSPFLEHIVYIKQPNAGTSAALNRGLGFRRSKYVMFLASDDWLKPNAVERLTTVLDEERRVGIAYGQMCVVDAHGCRDARAMAPVSRSVVGVYQPIQAILAGSFLPAPASMYRREAIDQVGGFEDFPFCQDWLMAVSIALNGWLFCGLTESIANYRRHGGNITCESNTGSMLRDEIRMLNQILENGVSQSDRHRNEIRKTIRHLERLLAWNYLANERPDLARDSFRQMIRQKECTLKAAVGLGLTLLPKSSMKTVLSARGNRGHRV